MSFTPVYQPIILASASPRRKQILGEILGNSGFYSLPSTFDESLVDQKDPSEYAQECAINKAKEVYNRTANLGENRAVLGADTVVFAAGKILGKPADDAQARQMLGLISGKPHSVFTAVCIVTKNKTKCETAQTTLLISALTNKEIDGYVAGGSPFDKAGAYGLQDEQIRKKLKQISGELDTVIGLPARLVQKLLQEG